MFHFGSDSPVWRPAGRILDLGVVNLTVVASTSYLVAVATLQSYLERLASSTKRSASSSLLRLGQGFPEFLILYISYLETGRLTLVTVRELPACMDNCFDFHRHAVRDRVDHDVRK